ncbi:MAG: aldo/keto reductase [Candidatus Hodarchaeales archaeon]|jgi:aryl-alcohol dehydrogenase-like predicted oxidoreductase
MHYEKVGEYRISKLTMGTAQLGLKYGIANKRGKLTIKEATKLIEFSFKHGITSYDTSSIYGDSERILGSVFKGIKSIESPLFISTKMKSIDKRIKLSKTEIRNIIRENVKASLSNLQLDCLPAYLLHDPKDIYLKDGLVIEYLNELVEEGIIDLIGVSIYNPEEIREAFQYKEIQIIQAPINIFDQRVLSRNILSIFNSNSKLLFARSIFLQGLFFLDPNELPKNLSIAKEPLKNLNHFLKINNLTKTEVAISFVKDIQEVTSLVIGVETLDQISKNVDLVKQSYLPNSARKELESLFKELPIELINPSRWKL